LYNLLKRIFRADRPFSRLQAEEPVRETSSSASAKAAGLPDPAAGIQIRPGGYMLPANVPVNVSINFEETVLIPGKE
jgi:hypothetical protein